MYLCFWQRGVPLPHNMIPIISYKYSKGRNVLPCKSYPPAPRLISVCSLVLLFVPFFRLFPDNRTNTPRFWSERLTHLVQSINPLQCVLCTLFSFYQNKLNRTKLFSEWFIWDLWHLCFAFSWRNNPFGGKQSQFRLTL